MPAGSGSSGGPGGGPSGGPSGGPGGGRNHAFTERQASEIRALLRRVKDETGLLFSVYVGSADGDSREYARRLHATLGPEAQYGVLLFVDPAAHRLELVTGARARRRLDDRTCGLAAMSMSSAFSVGDLTGGIVSGISMLADHARHPPIAR